MHTDSSPCEERRPQFSSGEVASVQAALLGQLAAERVRQGLTQAELARRAGVSRMAIQRLEGEGAGVQLSTFVSAGLAVGLTPCLERAATSRSRVPPDCKGEWDQMVDKAWSVLRKEEQTIPSNALDAMREILKDEKAHEAGAGTDPQNLVHRGLAHNRLRGRSEGRDREIAFAASWETENRHQTVGVSALLPHLVPGVTQDQATAAATVVQWLGSEVGFDFLQRVLGSAGYAIVEAPTSAWA